MGFRLGMRRIFLDLVYCRGRGYDSCFSVRGGGSGAGGAGLDVEILVVGSGAGRFAGDGMFGRRADSMVSKADLVGCIVVF